MFLNKDQYIKDVIFPKLDYGVNIIFFKLKGFFKENKKLFKMYIEE